MDKKVVITGVSRGLGRALVDGFKAHGWHVAGCSVDAPIMLQMQEDYGSNHRFSVVDVRDNAAVGKWAQEVIEKMGPPDILINNAGIINQPAPLWSLNTQEFIDVMDVNVIGAFQILQAFLPVIIKNGKGTIVNISSSWGRMGEANFAPYCASKFAIEGLTQSLAKELPQGITVVALDPGEGINTDMLQKAFPQNAVEYPTAREWSIKALPEILKITSKDNGKSLSL